jgi:Putative Ig domain
MLKAARARWIFLFGVTVFVAIAAYWLEPRASAQQSGGPTEAPEKEIRILTDSELPDTYPHAVYSLHFATSGGVTPLHWRVETRPGKGALPPGLKLDDNGWLHGAAERTGEFQFTLSVGDSGQPQSAVQKVFTLRVRSALELRWKTPAHVNGNRIEGSVDVSNTTPDDIDLTFIAMAVPPNGRAVAIGYQHFVLPRGTVEKEVPFGETLPHGSYVVHVDAVGEVARKNLIYRDRMQTPSSLVVTVGP